jgi:signal transduction histidine kinase
VIVNLIINAIEAMSGLGEKPRELLIGAAKAKSDSVDVAVQDSSPGLAPATLDRIFDVYYSTRPGGLIGVSICRSIIEAHGGTIVGDHKPAPGCHLQFHAACASR